MNAIELAEYFHLDPATIRRWPDRGCPVVHRGGRGPGNATQFDLAQVRRWRGKPPGPPGMQPDEALRLIAAAFFDAFDNHLALRSGCAPADAACVLFLTFEVCCRAFNYRFPPGMQPEPIRALNAYFVK